MKKLFSTLFLLFLAGCCFSIYVGWNAINSPMIPKDGKSQNFIFDEGSSIKKAANDLKEKGLIEHPMFFVIYVRLQGKDRSLQAGEYSIDPGMTQLDLIKKMVKGEVILHNFTIVEGWTFAKMIEALNSNPNVKHTILGLSAEEIMKKIGHTGEVYEGRFAPDTYSFYGKSLDSEILVAAYNLMQERLQRAWDSRAKGLPYKCKYDALIVASLIEKETAVASEKPIVSGVILRRLNKGMLLQIDPTVIYALGDKYTGKLRKKDMGVDSTYNTYKRKGLPPTPIAMPGEDSIIAALNPTPGDVLYYVSKGDGTHEFSKTHAEQVKAIKKYLRKK